MNNKNTLNNYILLFERGYRPFLQGVRTALGIFVVILLYAFIKKDSSVLDLGLCVLCLTQSCVRTPRFRFEINLLYGYIISSALIFISYFFTGSFFTISIFTFTISFLLFISVYYKFSTTYSIFIYLIPQYSILFQKNIEDHFNFFLMNSIAFILCLFISTILIKPNVKKECLYEMRAMLRALLILSTQTEKFILKKDDISRKELTNSREEVFKRKQSLHLIMDELKYVAKRNKESSTIKDFNNFYILAQMQENFAETSFGLLIKMRNLEMNHINEKQAKFIFPIMLKTNKDILKFIIKRKEFEYNEIEKFYKKIYNHLNEIYNKCIIEKHTSENTNICLLEYKDNFELLIFELNFFLKKE